MTQFTSRVKYRVCDVYIKISWINITEINYFPRSHVNIVLFYTLDNTTCHPCVEASVNQILSYI
jgi:hypothetical protein